VIDFEADDLLTVEEFQASIEESFKRALNDLYSDAASCNPNFRQVDSVVAQFFVDDGGRRVEQKGFMASRRSLQESLDQNTTHSPSSAYNTSAFPSTAPTTIVGGSRFSRPPSMSPTIGFDDSSSVLPLLSVSGICNGCLNDLGLSNQLVRRALKEVGGNLRSKAPFE
jgi:hypothetical protein